MGKKRAERRDAEMSNGTSGVLGAGEAKRTENGGSAEHVNVPRSGIKASCSSRELHLRVLVYKLKQDAAEYNSASNYSECFASFMESEPFPMAGRGRSFVQRRKAGGSDRANGRRPTGTIVVRSPP